MLVVQCPQAATSSVSTSLEELTRMLCHVGSGSIPLAAEVHYSLQRHPGVPGGVVLSVPRRGSPCPTQAI